MKYVLSKIRTVVIIVWRFAVGLAGIISCIFAILGCYIAYTAVSEVYHLNIEIAPVIEKFRKDSIVVIERPIPIIRDSSSDNNSTVQFEAKHTEELDTDDSPFLRQKKIDAMRNDRDAFLEKMQRFFGK